MKNVFKPFAELAHQQQNVFLRMQTKGAKFLRTLSQNLHSLLALDKPLQHSGLGVLASNCVILNFALWMLHCQRA